MHIVRICLPYFKSYLEAEWKTTKPSLTSISTYQTVINIQCNCLQVKYICNAMHHSTLQLVWANLISIFSCNITNGIPYTIGHNVSDYRTHNLIIAEIIAHNITYTTTNKAITQPRSLLGTLSELQVKTQMTRCSATCQMACLKTQTRMCS